ncbi:MAG TPA: hypothetical protein VM821_04395 [Abditibacteriaceae bacterium]|jgi:hypothetical protein|nr:hypothetical protein [Abditibacteriaceae bacterium]
MKVYISLLDEGVECWRPVEAIWQFGNVYKVVGTKPDDESRQFVENDCVLCKRHTFQNNETAFIAYAKAK